MPGWRGCNSRALDSHLTNVALQLVRYMHAPVPIIDASHVFDLLAIAYVVLTIGVLFRRV